MRGELTSDAAVVEITLHLLISRHINVVVAWTENNAAVRTALQDDAWFFDFSVEIGAAIEDIHLWQHGLKLAAGAINVKNWQNNSIWPGNTFNKRYNAFNGIAFDTDKNDIWRIVIIVHGAGFHRNGF